MPFSLQNSRSSVSGRYGWAFDLDHGWLDSCRLVDGQQFVREPRFWVVSKAVARCTAQASSTCAGVFPARAAIAEIRQPLEQLMPVPMPKEDEQIREALEAHWHASAAGDVNAEHDIYADDAICDYPQSGERILGRSNLQALRSHHPGKPSGFNVRRILGGENLWITEYKITYQGRPAYTVSIMEFRNSKVVHETQYFADPFEAPDWRRQWVQRIA